MNNNQRVKVKSKFKCLLWCVKNGITRPKRYELGRWGKRKLGENNYYSYGKFARCGQRGTAMKKFLKDTWELDGYYYHKDCLIFLDEECVSAVGNYQRWVG